MRKTTKTTVGVFVLTLMLGGFARAQEGSAAPAGGGPEPIQVVNTPLVVDKDAADKKAALTLPTATVTGNRENDIATFRVNLDKWLQDSENRKSFSEADQKLYKAQKFDVMYDRAIKYGNYSKNTK